MHHIINLPSRPAANASQLVIIIIISITAITYLYRRSLGTKAPRKSHHIRKQKTTGPVYFVIENINIIIIQYRYTKPVAPVPVVVNILYIYFRY